MTCRRRGRGSGGLRAGRDREGAVVRAFGSPEHPEFGTSLSRHGLSKAGRPGADCADGLGYVAESETRRWVGSAPRIHTNREDEMKRWILAVLVMFLALPLAAPAADDFEEMDQETLQQMVQNSVEMFKIEDGVSIEDAIESMKLRANLRNFQEVADLPLSEQVTAMGGEGNYMRILAFCDALIANQMVQHDIIFASFLPCRIAVVEDDEGQGWIVTMNMDMMLHASDLPDDLEPVAREVRDIIYDIVEAGRTGAF